ncbi:MAG: hypothetical protein ABFC80_04760 [Coriobacteriales bacterium]
MSIVRPKVRLPLPAAIAIPVAAYIIRSLARGFDFSLEMPQDAIVLGALLFIVLLAIASRRARIQDERFSKRSQDVDDHDSD